MTLTLWDQEIQIFDSLQSHAQAIEQVGPGTWRMLLPQSMDLSVTARIIDRAWLILDAPLALNWQGKSKSCDDLWMLLQWNAGLQSTVKFALLPREQSVHLQAEIPLERDTNLTAWIGEACAGFQNAWRKTHGDMSVLSVAVLPNPSFTNKELSEDLSRLCREVGWPFSQRTDGSVAVELEVPREIPSAALVERQGDGMHVFVGVATTDVISQPCRQALGLLLLNTCAVVRMVRAVVGRNENPAMRFEVKFSSAPTATELGHALSALSVALRLCGREAAILQQDEGLAKAYLTTQGKLTSLQV